jgi:hypothetical protein
LRGEHCAEAEYSEGAVLPLRESSVRLPHVQRGRSCPGPFVCGQDFRQMQAFDARALST